MKSRMVPARVCEVIRGEKEFKRRLAHFAAKDDIFIRSSNSVSITDAPSMRKPSIPYS